MGRRGILVSSVLASLLLAGCSGSSSGSKPAATSGEATDPLLGSIEGSVTDDEQLPVANATVSIVELKDQGTVLTDALGRFGFYDIEPGRYRLQVVKFGFNTSFAEVNVLAAQISAANLMLRTLPVNVGPLIVSVEKPGYIQCSISAYYAVNACGQALGQQKNKFRFEVDKDLGYKEAVFELTWQPASAATGQELEMDVCEDVATTTNGALNCFAETHLGGVGPVGTQWAAFTSGAPPVKMHVTDMPVARGITAYNLEVSAGFLSPFPALQQPFTAYISLCYVEKCPADYTAIRPSE